MTASPELLSRLTDKQMNEEKLKRWLAAKLRKTGYELAVREIHGENTPEYYSEMRKHQDELYKLYKLEKRI